jgi:signal transduction histidine kinase
MSELPPSAAPAGRRAARRHGTTSGLRARLVRICVLPAAVVMLLGSAAIAYLLVADPSPRMRWVVLGSAAIGCLTVLIIAFDRANAAARVISRIPRQNANAPVAAAPEWLPSLRSSLAGGRKEIQRLVDQVRRGEQPESQSPYSEHSSPGHPFPEEVGQELRQLVLTAQSAVIQAASRRQVEVLVNLARRLQSLIHRAIRQLDELEHEVEDPELLKQVFVIDHLTTRVRRQVESLAVLGGAVPRRINGAVNMHAALRQAVAEVEHYPRVKVIPPVEGTLHGHAAADIIHLIAELVENATMFSPPDTRVELHAESVPAGLAVEIDDRGLPMPARTRERMNQLLAAPDRFDIGELLKDGRIGLYVVASLARRHGILVQLRTNIYGGTQAVVILPQSLLGDAASDRPRQAGHDLAADSAAGGPDSEATPSSAPEPAPAPARRVSAPLPPPASAPVPVVARVPGGASVPGVARVPGVAPAPAVGPAPVPAAEPAAHASPQAPGKHGGRVHQAAAPAPEPAAVQPDAQRATGRAGRPALPRRTGTHLVPQLREGTTAARRPNVDGPDMGMMAAFQRGRSRAESEDDPPGNGDPWPTL